jgi:hypothetical protein
MHSHTIYSSVDQVPSDQWDALTAADIDLTMDRRLIGAIESQMGSSYSYATIVVNDARGGAAAVACTWLLRLDLKQFPWLDRVVSHLPRIWQARLKIGVLFCGMPLPAGQNHIRIAAGADRSAVIVELNAALRALARKQHCALIVVKEFQAGECERLDSFCKAGFVRCEIPPRHCLVRQFANFDEYRNALKSRYRAQVNRSLKKFSAAGFSVEQVYGPDKFCEALTDEAHELYRNVYNRSKYKLEFLPAEFMRELGRRFGADASLTCVRHGDRLAGFTLGLLSHGIYYNVNSGLDYELNPIGDVYFNLFYSDMDYAWKRGAKVIDLGLTSDDFKSRLGTRIQPLYLYIDSTRRLFSWGIKASLPWTFPQLKPVPEHDVFKEDSSPASFKSTRDGDGALGVTSSV